MTKGIIFVIIATFLMGAIFITVKYYAHSEQRSIQITHDISQKDHQVILFYSEQCGHCQVVKKFITDNQVNQKIKIEQREVSQNDKNLQLLMRVVKKCRLDKEEIGVPFLWNGKNCLEGSDNIVHYFNQQLYAK